MVTRLLDTLAYPIRGLHQAAYVLAILTFGSQLLALVRDRVFAHMFGAGDVLDLYYIAFKVPDLVFALVASLVSAYVLIPRLTANREHTQKIISHTTSFFLICAGFASALLFVVVPSVLSYLFPQVVDSPHYDSFILLTRLLLLQPIFLGLSSIFSSITQIEHRFVLFALSPLLYNISIIFGTVFLYPLYGLVGIGIGVVIGAVLHMLIHLPILMRAKCVPHLRVPSLKIILPIIKESLPRSLALVFGIALTFVLTVLISRVGSGAVSAFMLASNLQAVPLSLIAVSYATAAFPLLSRQISENKIVEFKQTVITALRHLIFWSVILSVLILVLRAHLVRIILGTGSFDWDDTRLTAGVLALLVLSLAAQGVVLLTSRAFYASNKSWSPFFIQAVGMMLSVCGAFGVMFLGRTVPGVSHFIEALFRVEGVQGAETLLIVLGAVIGQIVMGLIAILMLSQLVPKLLSQVSHSLFQSLGAGILGGSGSYICLVLMGNIAPLSTFWSVLAQGVLAGIVGIGISVWVLIMLESKEFKDLYTVLRRLMKSKKLPEVFAPTFPDKND